MAGALLVLMVPRDIDFVSPERNLKMRGPRCYLYGPGVRESSGRKRVHPERARSRRNGSSRFSLPFGLALLIFIFLTSSVYFVSCL
jgi:hypothetical protein